MVRIPVQGSPDKLTLQQWFRTWAIWTLRVHAEFLRGHSRMMDYEGATVTTEWATKLRCVNKIVQI